MIRITIQSTLCTKWTCLRVKCFYEKQKEVLNISFTPKHCIKHLYTLGKVLKVVREHYLRDDIWCGSEFCHECPQKNGRVLCSNPTSQSSLANFPHYVVIDTNVVLHQVNFVSQAYRKHINKIFTD